ncbi:MAG TPA: hypothetical protein VGG64_25145 [Pirellulales bacterium]|jgi:hypothetical protein
MSRSPRKTAAFSLFTFLDVMLCTLGALIIVLICVVRTAQIKNAEAAPEAGTEVEELVSQRETVEWRSKHLEAAREQTRAQLRDRRLELSHIEEHSRRLRMQLAELEAAEAALTKDHNDAQLEGLRSEARRLAGLAADAEKDLEQARKDVRSRRPSYAVVPYEGPNQTMRRPMYIECTGDRIILQPENVELSPDDFAGPLGPGNPLAAGLRAAREYLIDYRGTREGEPGEPYPLLLVRPDGIEMYYAARAGMTSWGSEFGYEFIDQDWKLEYRDPQPAMVESIRVAVQEARIRQRVLARAAPRYYAENKPAKWYRASSQGGIVQDSGPTDDDVRGNGRYGGSGRSGGRGGYANRGGSGRGPGSDGSTAGRVGGSGRYGSGNGAARGSNGTTDSSDGGDDVASVYGAAASGTSSYPGGGKPGAGPGTGAVGVATGTGSGGSAASYDGGATAGSVQGGAGFGGAQSGLAANNTLGNGLGNGTGSGGAAGDGPSLGGGTGTGTGNSNVPGAAPIAVPTGSQAGLAGVRAGGLPAGAGGGGASGDMLGGYVAGNASGGGAAGGSFDQRANSLGGNGSAGGTGQAMPGAAANALAQQANSAAGTIGDSLAGGDSSTGQLSAPGAAGGQPGGQPGGGPGGSAGGNSGGSPGGGPGGKSNTQTGQAGAGQLGGQPGGGQSGQASSGQPGSPGGQAGMMSASASGNSSSSSSSSSSASGSPSMTNQPSMPNLTFGNQGQTATSSMADSRGKNWGLPEEARHAVPIARPVRVECLPDKLILRSEQNPSQTQEIPLTARTEDSVEDLVSSVWKHVDNWGSAGRGMYWQPSLSVDVARGADGRYADLQTLLADSGLNVKQAPKAPAQAAKPKRKFTPW